MYNEREVFNGVATNIFFLYDVWVLCSFVFSFCVRSVHFKTPFSLMSYGENLFKFSCSCKIM
jgi:hypothetical protein